MASDLAFCTLGMFIIDEIEYINGKGSETSIIGGAGTYAALGARLAAGAKNAHRVGWIVDQGADFPSEFKTIIDRWGTSCLFRTDLNRLTTRAWNGYGPNEYRTFKYLTPKLRLEEHSLNDNQILASSFHMGFVLADRNSGRDFLHRSLFGNLFQICARPRNWKILQEAAKYVDVVSPNGDELAQFFSEASGKLDRMSMVESILAKCGGLHGTVAVVVRDGADGSRLYLEGKILHFRAYHRSGVGVVDSTGGGNTYLGALAMGLTRMVSPGENFIDEKMFALGSRKTLRSLRYRRHILAVLHATIAASFAIEQVGSPSLLEGQADSWNGEVYGVRFSKYVEREHGYILEQLDSDNLASA